MDLGLAGKVALVTGASKGIGLATARALADEGARVALASRSRERIDAAAASVGGAARGFVFDSADLAAVPVLLAEVEAALGPVDVYVANTGGPPANPDPLGFSVEEWEAANRTLMLSPMAVLERLLPGMRARGWGRVVVVSSFAVREPIASLQLSNAYRPGLLAALKVLAREAAADGVTLNAVLPGFIATDRVIENRGNGSLEAAEEAVRDLIPTGRMGSPEELAAAAAFLCSAPASYVNGVALLVDGALTHGI
jgi:3-oxoacyl-[acyl-carrier protein] reductase